MSKTYYRQPGMITGGPFICHNCGKVLSNKLNGSHYEVEFTCPRCKTEIKIKCNEAIPFTLTTHPIQEENK